MTLYEYIKKTPKGEEITVSDNIYDLETYFYNDPPQDDWQQAMLDFASKLNVVSFTKHGVVVDMYDLIERNLDNLEAADLFYITDVDGIMDDMENILAGNVSEDWFVKFVDCLV